jgi:hypothetical protein
MLRRLRDDRQVQDGVTAVGFKFDVTHVSLDGDECMTKALAEIESKVDLADPAVWNDGDDPPGLLQNLQLFVRANEPTWQMATAIECAFLLGKIAGGGTVTVAEIRMLGSKARGKGVSDAADDRWRSEAKPIWWEHRGQYPEGDPRRQSQTVVAKLIEDALGKKCALPDRDQLVRTIRRWDQGGGAS